MIIAIDIGNSTIGFGFLYDGKVVRTVAIENMPDSELVMAKLDNFMEATAERYGIRQVIVCSVVPDTAKLLLKKIKKFWGIMATVVGHDLKIPIENKYHHPRQVGKDRLLCAFAARELYGQPLVVIDLGTAITFDGVSKAGAYLGGAIIPGIRLSLEALFEKTALLPQVHVAEPKKVIGRSTTESIQSGIFHGYGALCDGMVARLGDEMGCHPKVVMTGGYAEIMRRFMRCPVEAVDQELIFKGMVLLAALA
ncbi:MAG: type III pantothenate kinase [Candidatus Omnitrophota bacterium]